MIWILIVLSIMISFFTIHVNFAEGTGCPPLPFYEKFDSYDVIFTGLAIDKEYLDSSKVNVSFKIDQLFKGTNDILITVFTQEHWQFGRTFEIGESYLVSAMNLNVDICSIGGKSPSPDLKNVKDVIEIRAEKIPVKKQAENGRELYDLVCRENYELMFKLTDGSPACVKLSTYFKLNDRGWGLDINNYIMSSSFDQNYLSDP